MVFADLIYTESYEAAHEPLYSFLQSRFDRVEGGLQGDSWIWIWRKDDKVAVDTFSAMTHQIKSSRAGNHFEDVIKALKEKYNVNVYPAPEPEPHED
jgi:hypothetical protein